MNVCHESENGLLLHARWVISMSYFAFPVVGYTLPIMTLHSNGSMSAAGFVVEVGLQVDCHMYSMMQLQHSDFFFADGMTLRGTYVVLHL